MSITSKKITAYTKTHQMLPPVPSPSYSAAQLQEWYDTAPEEARLAINGLIDALGATVAGDSGAKGIGVSPIAGVTGTNVQAVVEDLKLQVNGAVTGSIPDNSITQAKLAFTIATDAASTTIADTGAHFTATNVEGALDELFQSASSVKTNVANAIGAPATPSDTGTVLASKITTEKGRLAAEIGDGNSTSTLQYLADRLIVRSDAIATAVNDKGVAASSADTLAQFATKIGQIVQIKYASGSGTTSSLSVASVSGIGFLPKFIEIEMTVVASPDTFSYRKTYDATGIAEMNDTSIQYRTPAGTAEGRKDTNLWTVSNGSFSAEIQGSFPANSKLFTWKVYG